MDLPKGFVGDNSQVYGEVATHGTLPPEMIWKLWRVYTTTHRKLVDPTAKRLENFWWHVLGSDRRKLHGDTLARLYESISTGPTFVPLRGPPNRWEGPPSPRFNSQHESDERHRRLQQEEEAARKASEQSAVKELSASSSRPPPSHPILKKSRGDSKSGPRPTARFVSPHDSEQEEDMKNSEETSSGSTATSGLEMRMASIASPAKQARRKPATPTKKFVASHATKRRPVLNRRPSSQSSTGSDAVARETGPSSGSRYHGSQRAVPSIAEQLAAPDTASSGSSEAKPSAKALGKRPVAQPVVDSKASQAQAPRVQEQRRRPVVVQGVGSVPQTKALDNAQDTLPVYEVNRNRNDAIRTPPPIAVSTPMPTPTVEPLENAAEADAAPKTPRSLSQVEHQRPREATIGRVPSHGLLSHATARTSNIAVQGTLSVNDEPDFVALEALGVVDQDADPGAIPRRPSTSSLFAPTPPSFSPAVPLARSKSQLTLLLEREKARLGDKPRSKN